MVAHWGVPPHNSEVTDILIKKLPATIGLVSIFLLPKYFSNDIISIYEVIGGYFGKPVQKLSSIIFLFTRLLADGIRFLATAIIFNILSGWGIVPSVFVIGFVTVIYSYFGGIRSILWIDSIQFVLYLVCGLLAMYFLYTNHN